MRQLLDIAKLYNSSTLTGELRIAAIAEKLGRTQTTVRRLVRDARDKGLISTL